MWKLQPSFMQGFENTIEGRDGLPASTCIVVDEIFTGIQRASH